MNDITNTSLPSPVSTYIEATNAFDLERFMATLHDDALVNDHRDEFSGKDEIRAWAAREIVGARVTMKVVRARRIGAHAAVRAEIDGDFDKKGLPSPLLLNFYFAVTGENISGLVIVLDKAPDKTRG